MITQILLPQHYKWSKSFSLLILQTSINVVPLDKYKSHQQSLQNY